MNNSDQNLFNALKKKIELTFLERNKISLPIKDWKGKDIVAFQEDLFDQVKEKVSEKWFYTYLKNNAETLPRIDILNFLSVYVGHKNWDAFKAFNSKKETKKIKRDLTIYMSLSILVLLFLIIKITITYTFKFCFIDEDKNQPINTILNIKILPKNESPIYLKTDSLGCFTYKTKTKKIKFVVQSPYYKTDTIVRNFDKNDNGQINLQTDDYALMLQYYTNGNTKDWQKRKNQLDLLIEDNAQIYQLFNNANNIEIYSKQEFIQKLTIPTNSLKGVKILDKTYKNDKIVKLKFIIK